MSKYTFLNQKEVNKPTGKIVSFNSILDVSNFITQNNYSGGHYHTGKRLDVMLACINFIILDIDDFQPSNKNISDVKKQIQNLNHLIAPTKSHQIIKNGKINDRYRIILFVDQPIIDSPSYKKIAINVCKELDLNADPLCFNVSHFYYSSSSIYSINDNGINLEVAKFLKNDDSEIKQPIEMKFQYFLSEISISSKLKSWINSFISKPIQKKKEIFIRILMAQHNLVRNDERFNKQIGRGANIIPQEYLSNYLGIEPKTIRRWIKELIKLGQLQVVCEKSGKGYKGKDYRALDELKSAVIDSFYVVKEMKIDVNLPSHIDDGLWDSTLIRAVWAFQMDAKPDRFYDWVKSLPTFSNKPNRLDKMERAWINMKKRIKYFENKHV